MKLSYVGMIFSILVLIHTGNLFAQKAGIKRVKGTYINPPEEPLENNVLEFYTKITNKVLGLKLDLENEQKRIDLKGYDREIYPDEAHLLIHYSLVSSKAEKKVFKEKYKEKVNDSTTVEKEGAIYKVRAYLETSLVITDQLNEQVLYKSEGNVLEEVFTSRIFTKYNDAVKAVNASSNDNANALYKKMFEKQIIQLNAMINKTFGFPRKYLFYPIARGKGRKFDYSDLLGAFDKFNEVVKVSNTRDIEEPEIKKLGECIQVWENAMSEYKPKTKKTRIGDKNIGYLYTNISSAYFIMKDWTKLYEYAEKAKEFKGARGEANMLEGIAKELERLFKIQEDNS